MESYLITINGKTYEVDVERKTPGAQSIASHPAVQNAVPPVPPAAPAAAAEGRVEITAGAAGKVWKICSAKGQKVSRGETILILEAMKMEIPVVAPEDGVVAGILVSEGDSVASGAPLAMLA